ncbi:MAG TPA: winged helix-turn-helix domain-containing protein [Candidatus Nanoarchaeia archaeon]|nr:winged helix-turn-helix domain-containing protein [Candidatus Nanoarchaeia archaeon]
MPNQVTLYKIKRPEKLNINSQLQWFSQSLGLFNKRDKEKSCFRIFIALVEAKKSSRYLSSDEIAEKANLTRATIIHHLKNLEDHGLIKKESNRYSLSCKNFSSIIQHLQEQFKQSLEELEDTANNLDKLLELK